jgi:hypothetical protein
MRTWTDPRDPGGRRTHRKRGLPLVAAGAAVALVALGATATAVTLTGNSRQASLSGAPRQDVAVAPSMVVSGTPAAVTSAPGAPKARALTPPGPARPGAPSGLAPGPAKSPGPSAAGARPASSAPATGTAASASAGGAAPSAPATRSASPTRPAPSASATGSAPSGPAAGGASGQGLSVSAGCASQTTVQVLTSYSCPVTASGGTPGYSWTLFINGQLADTGGSLPLGLETTSDGATYTLEGKPGQWGTFTFTVTVQDSEVHYPPVTASTTFTLTVPEPPASERLP